MNDQERAALRMYVSGAIADYGCKVYGDDDECMRVEEDEEEMIRIQRADSIVSYVDRLLAAADAPGLDELLNSVHPEATIDLGITLPGYQDKGRWGVTVFAPSGTTWESTREVNGLVRRIEGTGPTRYEAIKAAVTSRHAALKAQESDDELDIE